MSYAGFLDMCAAQGMRIQKEKQTAFGMVGGVALLIDPAAETVELSVNLSEKHLPKLVAAWQSVCPGLTAARKEDCRILLHCPSLCSFDAVRLEALLQRVTTDAVSDMQRTFTDRHEKDRDPFFAYLRGFFGALVGALVGALPWFALLVFANWNMWYLLGLVGAGSFYGYRLFGGAHSTRFALICISAFTLLSILLFTFGLEIYYVYIQYEYYAEAFFLPVKDPVTIPDAIRLFFSQEILVRSALQSVLLPLLISGASLFALRHQILVYTHESSFLRRGKPRRK